MPANFEKYFKEMIALLQKVEAWWFINFEMPSNPDLDNQMIDASSIIPGQVFWLRLMSEVALGFKKYYEELSGNSHGDSSD